MINLVGNRIIITRTLRKAGNGSSGKISGTLPCPVFVIHRVLAVLKSLKLH
jgi:hypothetical protein